MIKQTLLFSLFTVLLFAGCDKPLLKYNPDFEGKWRTVTYYSEDYADTITSELVFQGKDGAYNYGCREFCDEDQLCDCITQQAGRTVVNKPKTQMKIGSTAAYPLTIDVEPYQDVNGVWRMEINGEEFIKVE